MEEQENTEVDGTKKIYHFGEKIRTIREKKHMTLKAVAQQAGVSESLVSQIERNRVSPAIDTLLSLANVLDINLEYLFEEYNRSRPVSIIRHDERRTMKEDEITFEEIVKSTDPDDPHAMESYFLEIPVGSHTHRGNYGHLGREMGIIVQGTALFRYENKEYILNEGDSISFSAAAPHTLENGGNTTLRAMWVVSPAQRFI